MKDIEQMVTLFLEFIFECLKAAIAIIMALITIGLVIGIPIAVIAWVVNSAIGLSL